MHYDYHTVGSDGSSAKVKVQFLHFPLIPAARVPLAVLAARNHLKGGDYCRVLHCQPKKCTEECLIAAAM